MCLKFPGTSPCGLFGSCSANNTCLCEPGWEPSLEFIFFPYLKDDRLEGFLLDKNDLLEQLPCYRNDRLMRACFALCLIGNLAAILLHLPNMNSLRRFLRQLPLMASFVCFALAGGLRLFGDGVDRSFTDDIVLSVIGAVAISGQSYATNVFTHKYVSYHLIKMNKMGQNRLLVGGLDSQRLLQYCTPLMVFTDACFIPMLILPAALEDRRMAGIIQYTNVSYYLFRTAFHSILAYLTISGLIKDMSFYIKTVEGMNGKKTRFFYFCQGASINLRLLIKSNLAFGVPQGISNIVYLSAYGLEGIQVYTLVCLGFAWAVLSCSVSYLLKKNFALSKLSKNKAIAASKEDNEVPS